MSDVADEELLRALRNLGDDYEPDVASITRRVRGSRARNSRARSNEPNIHYEATPLDRPTPSHREAFVRHGRSLLLPAAAVLLVMGGIVFVASSGGRGGRTSDGTANSSAPLATAAAAAEPPAPDAKTPSVSAERIGPAVSSTRTRTQAPTAPRSHPPAGATARISVQTVTTTTTVNLTSPPLLGWLALGTRADLKQVRSKNGGTAVTVGQPASAGTEVSPFRISWTDGIPEQDHTGATTWLKSTADQGLSVTIPGAHDARTVVLYAGSKGLQATIEVSGDGMSTSPKALGSVSPLAKGLVVTVNLPPTGGPTRIQLGGTSDSPTAELYLAAITVSR
jgi:hypothetical protein